MERVDPLADDRAVASAPRRRLRQAGKRVLRDVIAAMLNAGRPRQEGKEGGMLRWSCMKNFKMVSAIKNGLMDASS